jgi:hypothetical protein
MLFWVTMRSSSSSSKLQLKLETKILDSKQESFLMTLTVVSNN